MIRYALKCENGHSFQSWFQSADAFDRLFQSKMINCTQCNSSEVSKSLMAPAVRADKKQSLSSPETPEEEHLSALRKEIEENADYVGPDFAKEARKLHEGNQPTRNIWGEAKPEDAIKLIEDGIPVAPLPFTPRKQTN